MTAAPLLNVNDLRVRYGRVEAVHGVSITVAEKQIVTVIGANGAGKSTLLNAIAGVLPATGVIQFDGVADRAGGDRLQRNVEHGMALVPERRELFTTMSVEDNLALGAYRVRGDRDAGRDLVFSLFPRLAERRRQRAGSLSGGERQMLAIGRALMSRPRLLLLDEPSLGLAPLIVRDTFRLLGTLREHGMAILLVEQNARLALQTADYAYVLEMGSCNLAGPAATLARDSRVAATYLGLAVPPRR